MKTEEEIWKKKAEIVGVIPDATDERSKQTLRSWRSALEWVLDDEGGVI